MQKKLFTLILLFTMTVMTGCGDEKETLQNVSGEIVEIEPTSEEKATTELTLEVETEPATEVATEPETTPEMATETERTTESELSTGSESVPEPEIIQITINAVGDITLGTNQQHSYKNSFHQYYDNYGQEYFLQNVKEIFEADDFTIGNFEGTLTESNNRNPKLWNHKGKPEYVRILTYGSIEAVSLGNNHIMDYYQEGADDTMKYISEAGIEYALSGEWGNRYGLYETKKGISIGFVSVNEHYDEAACYQMLGDGLEYLEEAGADLIIACTHWGGDKVYEPEPEQYLMGKWCIDMGYDVVLGCHPHLLQGIEYYNGKYIVHSMGNFCYGGNKNPSDKETMIWQQTFTFIDGVLQEDSDVTIIPCRLSSVTTTNDYCPVVLEGEEAELVIQHINERSEEFGVRFDNNGKHIKEEVSQENINNENTDKEAETGGNDNV